MSKNSFSSNFSFFQTCVFKWGRKLFKMFLFWHIYVISDLFFQQYVECREKLQQTCIVSCLLKSYLFCCFSWSLNRNHEVRGWISEAHIREQMILSWLPDALVLGVPLPKMWPFMFSVKQFEFVFCFFSFETLVRLCDVFCLVAAAGQMVKWGAYLRCSCPS